MKGSSMNNIKSKKRQSTQHLYQQGLSWRQMVTVMNENELNYQKEKISSNMSARGEYLRIMEKLSSYVWQFYHPGENPNSPTNKKHITDIAKSDYFAELISDALYSKTKNNQNK
jgi:hypothetical protein